MSHPRAATDIMLSDPGRSSGKVLIMVRNPSVVIIGAGVGGLTLALALRRRGIEAEILEQSAELREVGAAVALAANATRLLGDIGLGDSLAQVSTEPARMVHRDGRDGRLIAAT